MEPGGLAPLAGISPATGQPEYYTEGWIDPYEQYASPADKVHYGDYLWEDPPLMPWSYGQDPHARHTPPPVPAAGIEPENQALGMLPPGREADLAYAPIETGSHHTPWPTTGLADSVPFNTDRSEAQLRVSEQIHGTDTGQVRAVNLDGPEANEPWRREDINYLSAGSTQLAPVPDQIRGNMGLDHVQGFEPDARYGFNEGFVRMPSAHGFVAGNWMWLEPARRPVEVRPTGRHNWPVGDDSPFTGQVPGTHGLGDIQGATLVDYPPAAYTPPAEPAVTAPLNPDSAVWSVW